MTYTEIDYSSFVADAFPDPIAILSTTGIIMWCNKATYEVSQLPPSELIGKRFTKLAELRIRDIPKFVRMFASILRGKSVEPFELTWNMKDGTILRSEARISLINTFEGQRAVQMITRDVSEIRKAEEQLRDSEKRLTDFFQNAQVPLFRTGLETGIILDCNKMGATLFGYRDPKELIGRVKAADHYINPNEQAELVKQLAKNGKVQHYQLHLKKVSGEEIWVDLSATSYPENGYLESVAVDVTERKNAEVKLQQSEERFRSVFENMLNGYAYCKMLTDNKGKPIDFMYLEVNNSFERLTGLKRNDVVGKRVTEAIPGIKEETPEIFDIYGKVAQTGEPTEFEIDFTPLDIWLKITVISPERGYFAAIFENITERKRAEESLRESEARFRSIFEQAAVGVSRVDKDGLIIEANNKLEEMLGYDVGELVGVNVFEITTAEDMDLERQLSEELLAGIRESYSMEKHFFCKDGHQILGRLTVSLSRDSKGEVDFTIGVLEDITEQKRNEAIRTQQEREIDLYGSLLRHNLSNDLGLILSYIEAVEMMLQTPEEEVLSFLNSAKTTVERMADLLKSFGRPQDVRKVDIVEFIRRIADEAREAEKGLRIYVSYEEETSEVSITAGSLLALVFMNLFRNAAQHAGAEPQIEVRVSEDENQLNIIVSDDGPGIPEKIQDRLFSRGTSSKGEAGGLGLYLSREILERTGGSIELLKDTEGAVFHLTLPTGK